MVEYSPANHVHEHQFTISPDISANRIPIPENPQQKFKIYQTTAFVFLWAASVPLFFNVKRWTYWSEH